MPKKHRSKSRSVRRRRRPTAQQTLTNRNAPPSIEQIAELNALLSRLQQAAYELNLPLANILLSATVDGLRELLLSEAIYSFVHDILSLLLEESPFGLVIMFAMIPCIIYIYYQLFSIADATVQMVFPNGLGFSRQQHPGYAMQKQLGTANEVQALIDDLKLTIAEQQGTYRYTVLALIMQLLPFLSSLTIASGKIIFQPPTIGLTITSFGPAIRLSIDNDVLPIPSWVGRVIRQQQSIKLGQWLARRWSNLNIPKQLKTLTERLHNISALVDVSGIAWQSLSDYRYGKESSMLSLKLDRRSKVRIALGAGISHKVTIENYIIELHRFLLAAKLPVYVMSKDQIIVGFCSISARRAQKLRRLFEDCLHELVQHENKIAETLALLNTIGESIKLKNIWDCYTSFNREGKRITTFYLNDNKIPAKLRDTYLDVLDQLTLNKDVIRENEMISLMSMLSPPDDLPDLLAQMTSAYDAVCKPAPLIEEENIDNNAESDSGLTTKLSLVPVSSNAKQKKPKRRHNTQGSSRGYKCKHNSSGIYPSEVDFGNGFRFFRATLKSNTPKPAKFAYPIRVSYIPRGHAYATIDYGVFPAIKRFVSKQQVLAKLASGKVHGYRQGGDGIQIVGQNRQNPPTYSDVNGQIHHAALEIKFVGPNIRIFGHKNREVVVEGERYVCYRFDGPGFGH